MCRQHKMNFLRWDGPNPWLASASILACTLLEGAGRISGRLGTFPTAYQIAASGATRSSARREMDFPRRDGPNPWRTSASILACTLVEGAGRISGRLGTFPTANPIAASGATRRSDHCKVDFLRQNGPNYWLTSASILTCTLVEGAGRISGRLGAFPAVMNSA